MFKPIYSRDEHNRVLLELNLLDDDDDWELFKLQERKFHEINNSISLELWNKYVV